MKSSTPPRLAVWLLQHFGPQLNQEALTGDLNEALAQGRSSKWYWRQVLAAIPWRKHLYALLMAAAWSWVMTLPSMWHSAWPSRPLAMAILTATLLAARYVPGMLGGKLRALLAALVVIFFCLLLRSHRDIDQYAPLGGILVFCLVFHRKALAPPPYHLTVRELIYGDPDTERKRLVAKLHLAMMQETDPKLRQAYAQSIAALKRNLPPETKAAE